MKLSDAQISRAMQLLRLTPEDFRVIERAPSFEEGQRRLAVLKERVKKLFRKAAMELHPDRTNNDPAKTDDFKLVSAVVEDIERLAFSRPPPPPPQRMVFIRMHVHGFSSSGATTTSTSFTGNGWGF
jgi:DNA-directed RNA polymerase specialized sigma24 family protein